MNISKKIIVFMIVTMLAVSGAVINAFASETYIVAGVSGLCGSNWDANDVNNKMTLNSSNNLYVKEYSNVAAGTYELKVVGNGNWYGDETGNNVKFNVTAACNVKVLFDSETHAITVEGSNVTFDSDFNYTKVATVGNGSGAWLNGASWDPAAASNVMTEVEKGLFEISYKDVAAGNYELKFAFDGAWTDNFGAGAGFEFDSACEAVYNGSNIAFSVSEESDLKITLDIRDFDYKTKSGAIYTIEFVVEPSQPTGPSDGDNTGSADPSVKPADPTNTPDNDVETSDSSKIVLTTMIGLFVISAIVIAISALKRKAY